MIPPKKNQPEENLDAWLMSYADMITLLLAFFVIFVATSEPKQDRLAAATKGMKEKFGTVSLDSPFTSVYRNLTGIVASNEADRNVAVEKTARGLKVELSSLYFFEGDTADIPESQMPLLRQIAESLKSGELTHTTIEVEGHTDNLPINSHEFSTNWELAASRATRIVRLLIDEGVQPTRLRATSFAETKPTVPNEDARGNPIPQNRARNQRVVIRVEK